MFHNKTVAKFFIVQVVIVLLLTITASAQQINIAGPAGSGAFGTSVTVLPNGNIVVTDPFYDAPGPINDVGAVYLYNGATLALISTLTGSTAGDQVGSGGVTALTNGNYVVISPNWRGAAANVGAVTFGSGVSGVSGAVSSSNSLVGSTAADQAGNNGVTALTNGNYVVRSQSWDNGLVANVGAVTFGSGVTGISGAVSSSNSLVGSTANNFVGSSGVTALTNGNYVVNSPNWDISAGGTDAGAVTFGSGVSGISGAVSSSNSLVGSTANDNVGISGVTALTNGNYVVPSTNWDNGAVVDVGAVTFGSGVGGISGAVSSSNSLVGSTANDNVGISGVTALTNGNYVVRSTNWDGAATNVGAVTFGSGVTGISGAVSSSNSLVGSTLSDLVGNTGVTALTNGNYVVSSFGWDGAATNVGAVTFGSGVSGISGAVSSANSLVGSTAGDQVGNSGVTALTNGNYVVRSPGWDGAAADAGAVTFGSGVSGISGAVNSSNSLVGSTLSDLVGNNGVTALTNGNYVVRSANWDNGAVANVGAVTFGSGVSGISGAVSSSNSLVGPTAGDNVGISGITALTNGNYVVISPNWDNGAATNAGAVTFGSGVSGISGFVSSVNSLVGSTGSDIVGNLGVTALTNGNYVVLSPNWDGALADAGAVTLGSGMTGISGAVSSSNSLVGLGLMAGDNVGSNGVTALTNGNYVVSSQSWDNGGVVDAGAFTFGNGASGTVGAITSGSTGGNSVVGTVTSGTNTFAFDATRNRLFVGRSPNNIVSVLSFTTTAVANGDLSNPATWSGGVLPNGLITGIIPSGITVSISSIVSAGLIHVQCGGNLTGGGAAAYIVGSVRRDFCAAANESFTYPIGDANNYSPLTVANTNGTGALTAAVTDIWLPGLPQALSLSRHWSLTGAGITTDLTFNYTNADVNGMEASYRAFKRNSSTNLTLGALPSSVNAAANTITVTGVSQFSDWGAGDAPLAPSAAGANVAGRVATADGNGIRNVIVSLTGSDGVVRMARTGSFGYYSFDDVTVGETYVITVAAKRFAFANATQIVTVNDNIAGLDFTALE